MVSATVTVSVRQAGKTAVTECGGLPWCLSDSRWGGAGGKRVAVVDVATTYADTMGAGSGRGCKRRCIRWRKWALAAVTV